MDVLFILDFDGVLFNSAYEAFQVSRRAIAGEGDAFRQDVDYQEFLSYRAVVTDAWQYNRLFGSHCQVPREALRLVEPNAEDWAFAKKFFAARAEMMKESDWAKSMPPYDFFLRLKPLLLEHPDRFAILSTRNKQSIEQTMQFHDADILPIFGQESIREHGSKLEVAKAQGWLEKGKYLTVYLDDMNSHLEPFEGVVHLPLHADWGYDRNTVGSLSDHQVMTIFRSLLALSARED
ncbi:hypothetical protein E3U23_09180 [Erythrobacter litoralis]|uniref:hypothetical protein n=1 Tax=Erythrobacter litoralis TaxID=39960 RepID=UPI002435D53B|nr:hypothetical protein [Erythrobacter litoralis]MDG6079364.1 hypothetical protein [Erythrobacter litoralis]